jgi:hypothetical protein
MSNLEFEIDLSGESITKLQGNLLLKEFLEDAAEFAYQDFKRKVPTRRTKRTRLKNGRTKSAVRKDKRVTKTAFGYQIAIGVNRIKNLREGESPEYPLFVHQGTKGRTGRFGPSSLSKLTKSGSILARLEQTAAEKNAAINAPARTMDRITPKNSEFLVFKSPFSKNKKGNSKGLIFTRSVQGQFMQPYLPRVGQATYKYMQGKSILDFRGNIGI